MYGGVGGCPQGPKARTSLVPAGTACLAVRQPVLYHSVKWLYNFYYYYYLYAVNIENNSFKHGSLIQGKQNPSQARERRLGKY